MAAFGHNESVAAKVFEWIHNKQFSAHHCRLGAQNAMKLILECIVFVHGSAKMS